MLNFWAIDEQTAKELSELIKSSDLAAIAKAQVVSPDPETTIENGVAVIPIKGILTKEADNGIIRFLAGGGTSYQGIIESINAAEIDPDIKSVLYVIDSPGGVVNGLFDTTKAIKDARKPSRAFVTGRAASAAYALASQADEIVASNSADLLGSIGIVQSFFISESIVDVTSTNAPNKAPDVSTESGKQTVREQLDMLHSHFATVIAEGRGTTADTVNRDFGRGGIFTADVAMRRGMIDSIDNVLGAPSTAAINAPGATAPGGDIKGKKDKKMDKEKSKTKNRGGKKMSLRALFDEHPDARAEFEAELKTAQEKGVTQERTRVTAHLANIEHSKDVAVKAIVEGKEFDQAAMSEYMNAAMKVNQGGARAADNPGAIDTPGDDEDGQGGEAAQGGDAAIAAALGKGIDDALSKADESFAY